MRFRRNTRQRQVILGELRRLTSHPTAAELHQIVRQQLPRVSLGTVYRNLEILVAAGAIRKLGSSGRESRFDPDTSSHYHLRCMVCGRYEDVADLSEITIEAGPRDLQGWEVREHSVEMRGVCPACRDDRARGSTGPGPAGEHGRCAEG